MRGARKKVVFLAGLGVAAVLALAGLQWKELAIRYHLQRMRGAPAYWLEGMEKPDGTPQKEASSRFLESDGAFLRVLEGLGVDESKSPRRPPVIAAPPVLRVLFGKPRDPRKAPAFRALGELGLKAQPGKSVNIVRQLMQGLEEEEKKNSNPLDAGDSRILTGLR